MKNACLELFRHITCINICSRPHCGFHNISRDVNSFVSLLYCLIVSCVSVSLAPRQHVCTSDSPAHSGGLWWSRRRAVGAYRAEPGSGGQGALLSAQRTLGCPPVGSAPANSVTPEASLGPQLSASESKSSSSCESHNKQFNLICSVCLSASIDNISTHTDQVPPHTFYSFN